MKPPLEQERTGCTCCGRSESPADPGPDLSKDVSPPNTYFALAVVSTLDGLIARDPSDAPSNWASPEEQDLFFSHVEAADWSIMGRKTHEAADKPHRRRIVFSTQANGGWRRPTQLWLNPDGLEPEGLHELVSHVHPLRQGLVLGGTRVHDWFFEHQAIGSVFLTIEPVRFGEGLPIVSAQSSNKPERVLENLGFRLVSETTLNAAGTRYQHWKPTAQLEQN